MSNQKPLQLETTTALLSNYFRYKVEFVKGEGAYLFDSSDKEYLDFLSGIAVTGFGNRHPKVLKAVREQIENVWHTSNLFQSSGQEILAGKLAEHSGLGSVFFCNSGTEANEAAIKFTRKWGNGRSTIITALGGFHGRTLGSLSASGQYKLWEGFFPLTPGFVYVPYDDIEAIENSINHDTVAIMIEPIQGESGIIVPSEGYLRRLREICDNNNLLLVVDEVQTGMGRTGKLFAHQWEEIKPDIITLAKGIANGLPLGAIICSNEVAEYITPGSHGSTFGGNPVAVAAANVVMDLLTEDVLFYNSLMGKKIKVELKHINHPLIKDVRGKGLMIGIEFCEPVNAKDVALILLEEGVVVGTSGDRVIRILPPFIITDEEITKFMNIFTLTLNNL
ncbi:MAG: aspartate aminotransferase family protein [Ignavibacteria bacterium]|nr:aspartate aminotransferase family protein [Ignavibacteria bacterium]MDP3830124.1 aspartate aminotransferase family protein [Ignavibacteriaceae bacterium]